MRAAPAEPHLRLIRERDTHRLVPSKYRAPESVLARLAEDDDDLAAIFELEQVTNDRLLAEHQRLADIGPHELVFGVPSYHVINAAFCHAHPLGSRFNGPDRGAWYAAFELRTAQAEVAFHRSVELAEIDWQAEERAMYDDYLADFSGEFHDLRRDRRFADCFDERSYRASQALSQQLLERGSLGVVYPSVRRPGGTCLACFRPAVVSNVRRDGQYAFTFAGADLRSVKRVGGGTRGA
jgi:RES domain-containing protein